MNWGISYAVLLITSSQHNIRSLSSRHFVRFYSLIDKLIEPYIKNQLEQNYLIMLLNLFVLRAHYCCFILFSIHWFVTIISIFLVNNNQCFLHFLFHVSVENIRAKIYPSRWLTITYLCIICNFGLHGKRINRQTDRFCPECFLCINYIYE